MSYLSRLNPFHTTRKTKTAEGDKATAPQPHSEKSQIFGLSLPGLKRRSSTATSTSASTPSMPPRSALQPKPRKALGDNSLVNLMHADGPTEFTSIFIKEEGDRQGRLAKRRAGVSLAETAKPTSSHEVIGRGPADKTAMNRALKAKAREAGAELFELVKAHPRGTFEARIEQGEIPKELLAQIDLGGVDHADIILEFQNKQSKYNDYLLHTAALNLKKLEPGSTEQAQTLLQSIVDSPNLHLPEEQGAHEITEESTPQQAILAALAELPEIRRGDLIDAYENLDKPHPQMELQARGQQYLETIGARLAEFNRPGQ